MGEGKCGRPLGAVSPTNRGDRFSPRASEKGTHPPAPRCEPSETHVGLRAPRTVRQICVVLSHEVLATGYSSNGKLYVTTAWLVQREHYRAAVELKKFL